ncbi:MAG TPA: endonuclease/exonuclease/phosphatase family protein [Chitinophagaceae bacterium]
MKKYAFVFLLVVVALGAWGQLRVASYNVRLDHRGDSGNLWEDRRWALTEVIRYHDFDVFGTQEGFRHQLEDIQKALPQYAFYGRGRDDGKEKGEHAAVFFKKDRFRMLKQGDFWLSETPEKPSMGWDGRCCHRICSWVQLQDTRSGRKFFVFNAHFDHEGVVARKESSKLILQKIKEIAGGEPVVLTGDFNGGHESEWYGTLARSGVLKDTFRAAKRPYALNGSFNGFGKALTGKEIIDHIFTSSHFKVSKWALLTDTYHGKFPSDHFPVVTELRLDRTTKP